jgi:hypothetical protein
VHDVEENGRQERKGFELESSRSTVRDHVSENTGEGEGGETAHKLLDFLVTHVARTIETLEDGREELFGLLESRNRGRNLLECFVELDKDDSSL